MAITDATLTETRYCATRSFRAKGDESNLTDTHLVITRPTDFLRRHKRPVVQERVVLRVKPSYDRANGFKLMFAGMMS